MTSLSTLAATESAIDQENLDAVYGGLWPLFFLGVAAGAGVGYLIDKAFGN